LKVVNLRFCKKGDWMKKENRNTLLVSEKVNGQSQSKMKEVPLVAEIELTNCKLSGLPNTETEESLDFRFHRRGLECCLPGISSSVFAELGISLQTAISLLENKTKTSTGKITLSAKETETLRRVLSEYKTVHEKYSQAACHTHGLLAVIDKAGALYRNGNDKEKSAALKKIGWRSGKRQPTEPHADIFMNYLLLTSFCKPSSKNRMEAIKILTERFKIQSVGATIKGLRRTLANIKRTDPAFHVIIPSENKYSMKS